MPLPTCTPPLVPLVHQSRADSYVSDLDEGNLSPTSTNSSAGLSGNSNIKQAHAPQPHHPGPISTHQTLHQTSVHQPQFRYSIFSARGLDENDTLVSPPALKSRTPSFGGSVNHGHLPFMPVNSAGSAVPSAGVPMSTSVPNTLSNFHINQQQQQQQQQQQPASLVIHNIPRNFTLKDANLLFTFALDFISVELYRQTTAEDGLPVALSATAKFRNVSAAAQAQVVLEQRQETIFEGLQWPLRFEVRGRHGSSGASSTVSGSLSKSRFLFNTAAAAAAAAGTSNTDDDTSPANSAGGSVSYTPRGSTSVSSLASAGDVPSTERAYNQPAARSTIIGRPPIFGDQGLSLPSNSGQPGHNQQTSSVAQMQSPLSSPDSEPQNLSRIHSNCHGTGHGTGRGSVGSVTNIQQPSGAARRESLSGGNRFTASNSYEDPSKVIIPYNATTQAKAQAVLQNGGRVLPPANPADQNPPCNTLYVGNLPPDTEEAELKELFSKRPGYRRLCFRAKSNGPMCFVEFEDEEYAGKALEQLYGYGLSNSVKGGIRLSYSKNPLGVRSRNQNHHMGAANSQRSHHSNSSAGYLSESNSSMSTVASPTHNGSSNLVGLQTTPSSTTLHYGYSAPQVSTPY